MTVADVVEAIRNGAQNEFEVAAPGQSEPVDDTLQLSFAMALIIQLRKPTILADALELAGKILCPIFDYAKTDEYHREMLKLRLQYRGVANNTDLQREWVNRTNFAANEGALDSLESAIRAPAWRMLGRERPFGAANS